MLNVENIYKYFLEQNIDLFTGVPDSLLKDFCAYVTDNTSKEKNIIAANEGAAIGIAAGHFLAGGNLSLVYMQNSGLGNAINPLLSLADENVYKIPMILMIGWRGEPGTKDEPQHKKQGEVTLALLEAMQIPFLVLAEDEDAAIQQLSKAISFSKEECKPYGIIVKKDTFSKYKLKNKLENVYPLSREEALKTVINTMSNDDIIVSTTGKLSRELFEYREATGGNHSNDFLTVGSMGHSCSIALGIALEKPAKKVWCLDGDGAFIMHMGAITGTGALSPANYRHIVFNNGAHESVGGQPTCAFGLDIDSIATGCQYKGVWSAETEQQINAALTEMKSVHGPSLLEIKINTKVRDDLGRPTIEPVENKINFIKNLQK